MALLNETNAQYYSGQQAFVSRAGANQTFNCTFNTTLVDSPIPNYIVERNGAALNINQYKVTNNLVTVFISLAANDNILVRLTQAAINDNYGSYEYIKLSDVINNFIVGYVGAGKLISACKRTDIMFHAKRGLQEFSYDTLKSIKSQELTIPPSLSVAIPQDYVNYVKCSWIDDVGAKHIIYPTRVTSNPEELPVQDDNGIPTQDDNGNNIESDNSITEDRWAAMSSTTNNQPDDYRLPRKEFLLGQRYGLQPEEAQVNGTFTINERLGTFSFSNELVGKLIILEYISDGLAYDADMKIPKMAEQAIYMHVAHGILSGRANVPEYIVNRFKRERFSALRNAKIRLSNIKTEEIAQVLRNKAKWIKH